MTALVGKNAGHALRMQEGRRLQAFTSLGRTFGGVEHLLPPLHPRHGLHVLPPVAVLHWPLLHREANRK